MFSLWNCYIWISFGVFHCLIPYTRISFCIHQLHSSSTDLQSIVRLITVLRPALSIIIASHQLHTHNVLQLIKCCSIAIYCSHSKFLQIIVLILPDDEIKVHLISVFQCKNVCMLEVLLLVLVLVLLLKSFKYRWRDGSTSKCDHLFISTNNCNNKHENCVTSGIYR